MQQTCASVHIVPYVLVKFAYVRSTSLMDAVMILQGKGSS